jgi:hypothetical protein
VVPTLEFLNFLFDVHGKGIIEPVARHASHVARRRQADCARRAT